MKGNNCPFSHGKFMSKADFEKAQRPRSASATRRESKGGGKGRQGSGSGSPTKQRRAPYHCNKFLKDGVCPFEAAGKKCTFPI